MGSMRVHELAKEFNVSSKELLDKLAELKISAKSHASVLNDDAVERIRKEYSDGTAETAADAKSAQKPKQSPADKKKAAEQAARRAAVEKERAQREAERANRQKVQSSHFGAAAGKPAPENKKAAAPAKSSSSRFAGLESQIEQERQRVAREAAEAKKRERAQVQAREVAKKRAVEEQLAAARAGKKNAKPAADAHPRPRKAAPGKSAPSSSGFGGLLAQIEQEKKRLDDAKAQAASAPKKQNKKKGGNKGRVHSFEPVVPELENGATSEDDRYSKMAVQAEKLQRDKVLAEARAAVAAATNNNEGEGRRKKRKEKRAAMERERVEQQAQELGIDADLLLDENVIEISQGATVGEVAEALGVASNEIIKRLFMLGTPMTLTQSMSDELIELVADDLGRKVRVKSPEEEYMVVYNDSESDLLPRPPVVTVMGHVDHGKTSLLDAIRETGVAAREAGGITQHIGASVVHINGRQITFIDTPGHEAFTAMRARGAQITDIAVLVVAADDGVMPQTIESINHAKAAGVPVVVAVNKIDKPGANPDRVRQELTEYGIIPEEWGGENMFVEVSAKKKLNIDELLETILLQADVLELKANPNAEASGYVIEGNLDKGRGSVATVLVNRGTLHPGDVIVAGMAYGRVRALIDPSGRRVKSAGPADPVEILGLDSVPVAGDEFRVFDDERDARNLAKDRQFRARLAQQDERSHMSLDDLFARIEEGKQTDLNLIVKADVQGSIEALKDSFSKMDQTEVRINVVHAAVGGITETDVTLAAASDAIIIGFNVRPMGKSKAMAEHEKVDIRLYRVIYQALEDINAARVGLLSPEIVEEDTGIVEVRETFSVPKVGTIAGAYVIEGEISRDDQVRIVRDGTVIYEGRIGSLRRFKDDVKSVKQGYECGIGIDGYQDIKIGDHIEGFRKVEHERTE